MKVFIITLTWIMRGKNMNLDTMVIGLGVVAVAVTAILYVRNYKDHHYGGKFNDHFPDAHE